MKALSEQVEKGSKSGVRSAQKRLNALERGQRSLAGKPNGRAY